MNDASYVEPGRLAGGVSGLLFDAPPPDPTLSRADPILPFSLVVLEPTFPVETLLVGLTTFKGTGALPAPRLATLGFSTPLSLDPEGRAGASPKLPPDGKRGFDSALTWKREILSLIFDVAPVRTAVGEDGRLFVAVVGADGEEDEEVSRLRSAILSFKLPVLGIVCLLVDISGRALGKTQAVSGR